MEIIRGVGSNDIQSKLLREAAAAGNADTVRLLIERGANVLSKDEQGDTALHKAAAEGHESVARLLLKQGADVSAADSGGRTALHRAAFNGHESIVKLFIESGAPLSHKDIHEWNPLQIAVFKGYESIVRLLLAQGADTEAEEDSGLRVLAIAAQQGHLAIAELLIASGATVDARARTTQLTALHHAVSNGREAIGRLLLKNGADVDAKSARGYTPLLIAISEGNLGLVKLLLEYGADKRLRLPNGRTALECAEGNDAISRLLEERQLLLGPVLRKSDDRLPENAAKFAHIPSAPLEEHQEDELKACKGFEAVVVDFYLESDREQRVEERASIFEMLYGRGPQAIMSEAKGKNLEGAREKFRWFHLPANNMEWVEVLVSRLFAAQMSGAALLDDEFKSNLGLTNSAGQHYRTSTVHSSFMRPMARSIKPGVNSSLGVSKADQFMLFMPFLHYETTSGHSRMARTILNMKRNQQYYRNRSGHPSLPTRTRISRLYVSLETLGRFGIDYELDRADPENYVIINRFVPEEEYGLLGNHTRELRERSGKRKRRTLNQVEKEIAELREELFSRRRRRNSTPSDENTELKGNNEAGGRKRGFLQVIRDFKESARSRIQSYKKKTDDDTRNDDVDSDYSYSSSSTSTVSSLDRGRITKVADWVAVNPSSNVEGSDSIWKLTGRGRASDNATLPTTRRSRLPELLKLRRLRMQQGEKRELEKERLKEEKEVIELQPKFTTDAETGGLKTPNVYLTALEENKGKAKEDKLVSEGVQDARGNISNLEEIEVETEGLKEVKQQSEGALEGFKERIIVRETEKGAIVIEEIRTDSPNPVEEGEGNTPLQTRPLSLSSTIEMVRYQDNKDGTRAGDAGEIGAKWEFESVKDEEQIPYVTGGKQFSETEEKDKEDGQAAAAIPVEKLQEQERRGVEAGPSSTQKGSHSSEIERSPGPPSPSSTNETDKRQDTETASRGEFVSNNDYTALNSSGTSSESFREDGTAQGEEKDKKADEEASEAVGFKKVEGKAFKAREETKNAEEDTSKTEGALKMQRRRRSVFTPEPSRSRPFERERERERNNKNSSPRRSRYRRTSIEFEGYSQRRFDRRLFSPTRPDFEEAPMTPDELNNHLIRGYLYHSVNWKLPPLQPRRTLDEYFYTHLESTLERDQDQVVYRYTKWSPEPKIFMVDQLWLWVLNEDTVISCCPQRWDSWESSVNRDSQGLATVEDDPLSIINSIRRYLKDPTRAPIESVYDLAFTITNACASVFDQYSTSDDYQFFDFFERSLGIVMDKEAQCFNRFTRDLKRLQAADLSSKNDATFDALFDLSRETELLTEVKDIRDELHILDTMLKDQLIVLEDMEKIIGRIRGIESVVNLEEKQLVQQNRVCKSHIQRVSNMDIMAERTYDALNHLLNLKQKQANASEARSARKQAENTAIQAKNTARQAENSAKQTKSLVKQAELAAKQAEATANQGKTVLVFTVVTIIFLPLSFMATFFAINIGELQHDQNGQLPLGYVLKYMITISTALSIPFILLAFNQDRVATVLRNLLYMIAEGAPPRASLSGTKTFYLKSVSGIQTVPSRLAAWFSLLFTAVLAALRALVGHFNRWRRRKTDKGSQDDEDSLAKAEKGNVDSDSVHSRSRSRGGGMVKGTPGKGGAAIQVAEHPKTRSKAKIKEKAEEARGRGRGRSRSRSRSRSLSITRRMVSERWRERDFYAAGKSRNESTENRTFIDIPPKRSRVRIDRDTSPEITWQRYTGVRRSPSRSRSRWWTRRLNAGAEEHPLHRRRSRSRSKKTSHRYRAGKVLRRRSPSVGAIETKRFSRDVRPEQSRLERRRQEGEDLSSARRQIRGRGREYYEDD